MSSNRARAVTGSARSEGRALNCTNAGCGQHLQAAVSFCPFCGHRQATRVDSLRIGEQLPPKHESPIAAAAPGESTPTPETQIEVLSSAELDISQTPGHLPPEIVRRTGQPPGALAPTPGLPVEATSRPNPPDAPESTVPTEAPPRPRRSLIGVIAVLVGIAIGGHAVWSRLASPPSSPATAPPVGTAAKEPVQTVEEPAQPAVVPQPPAELKPSLTERRLADAQKCLGAGDYGCAWSAAHAVRELEPGNDAAMSIVNEVLRYVDQRVAASEQALQTGQLSAAQTALDDAQRAFNYDVYDARFDALNGRLYELRQAEEREAREVPPSARPAEAATGPDAVAQELLSEAQQSLALGNLDAAESLANKVLQRDPGNVEAQAVVRDVDLEKQRIKTVIDQSFEAKQTVKVK